jgi:hypothetical protein
MIFRKAPIMKEVEDYVFNSSTYMNADGSHPSVDTMLNRSFKPTKICVIVFHHLSYMFIGL